MTYMDLTNKTLLSASLTFDLELGVIDNPRGEFQRLSPINLKLLRYLVAHQGHVVNRTALFENVWPNQIVSDDVLTRAISDIRTQLAKLDTETKFIETLPKRGYRWAEPLRQASSKLPEADTRGTVASTLSTSSSPFQLRFVKSAAIYLSLALLLACASMWVLTQSVPAPFNLAVFPVVASQAQLEPAAKTLDTDLLALLRKNPRIKLLSKTAIAARPENPFPYLFNQFGTQWVLESRLFSAEVGLRAQLTLVDARTGFELHEVDVEAASYPEFLAKLARALEIDILADKMGY